MPNPGNGAATLASLVLPYDAYVVARQVHTPILIHGAWVVGGIMAMLGAFIYAELAGDGNSLSSYRITDSPPDGDGPIQSMRQALADAGATIDDVDYINAHGTSTFMNDRSESAAIRAVFASRVKDVAVSSTKSSMGHLIAAAGAVEVAICALAIHNGELPVNANLREQDPECDLALVRDVPERRRVRIAMSNSFGFGGSNSCVCLRRPDAVDGAGFRA